MSKKSKTPEPRTQHLTFPGWVTVSPVNDESGAMLSAEFKIIPGGARDLELARDMLHAVTCYYGYEYDSGDAVEVLVALLKDRDRIKRLIAEKNAAKIIAETV
jgi:hypothetical protein